jgi:protein disulfide isomerase
MTQIYKLGFLFVLATIAIAGYPFAEDDHIINLGAPTFDIAVGEFAAGLLIYYYEPFCHPCRKMWPELVSAAATLQQEQSRMKIAKIECHDEFRLCDDKGVSTYPTIYLYRQGKPIFEYRGSRTADGIVEWAHKVVDFVYPKANDDDDLFRLFSTAIVVGENTPQISEIYGDLHDQIDIFTDNGNWKSKIGEGSAVVLNQDGLEHRIPKPCNAQEIKNVIFGQFNDNKAVPNLNGDLSHQLQSQDKGEYLFFFRTKNFEPKGSEAKAFDQSSEEAKKAGLIIAYVNTQDDILGATMGKLFGVREDDDVAVGILNKDAKIFKKYKLGETITKNSISAFIKKYKDNNADRYYMTADPNAKQEHVEELIGSNFHDLTQDPDSNFFVMFYFPWCEWCVKLEPTWNSLAYRMRNIPNVHIARLDVSENDVPGFELSEFPVLVFFPAEKNKKFEVYISARNIKALQNYLFEKVPGLKDNYDL